MTDALLSPDELREIELYDAPLNDAALSNAEHHRRILLRHVRALGSKLAECHAAIKSMGELDVSYPHYKLVCERDDARAELQRLREALQSVQRANVDEFGMDGDLSVATIVRRALTPTAAQQEGP